MSLPGQEEASMCCHGSYEQSFLFESQVLLFAEKKPHFRVRLLHAVCVCVCGGLRKDSLFFFIR
eukprot:4046919-Amphidinium_carterae.1